MCFLKKNRVGFLRSFFFATTNLSRTTSIWFRYWTNLWHSRVTPDGSVARWLPAMLGLSRGRRSNSRRLRNTSNNNRWQEPVTRLFTENRFFLGDAGNKTKKDKKTPKNAGRRCLRQNSKTESTQRTKAETSNFFLYIFEALAKYENGNVAKFNPLPRKPYHRTNKALRAISIALRCCYFHEQQ